MLCTNCQKEVPEGSRHCLYCGTALVSGYYSAPHKTNGPGLSIASMVCGILSILFCCLWFLAIPLGIVGLALGKKAQKNQCEGMGMVKAGIVTSIIGVAIVALYILLALIGIGIHDISTSNKLR